MSKRPPKANWHNERELQRGDMKIVQGFAELRAERVFEEAPTCDECARERKATGDDEALCDEHLGQAMGMDSNWP